MSNFKLNVKLLNENAQIPKKSYPTDAGYDLCSCQEGIIQSKERGVVGTGISVNLSDINSSIPFPFALYGRIAPRSGLAAKHGIDVLAGVVDAGYTGEIKVILYNTSNEPFEYKIGDRIAQLIIEAMILTSEMSGDKVSLTSEMSGDKVSLTSEMSGDKVSLTSEMSGDKVSLTSNAEVDVTTEEVESTRGENGFGSSGV